ncbi:hypothetical protein [Yersinia aleksiciae]|uniref:Metalloprotease StcE beta-sandwich domain-containing protein n=1 Tax=Yersinia aleksiciae TaxID=263819 RepID=A0A0T9TWX8_YERAE|nr:hypothetical protein [Yersinia aleksiciae]CNL06672.1 Uncharacterised protein [Yersinia aleksiciae]
MSNSFFFTTPNQLGGGVLPSRYNEIVFELSDGNWVNDIVLPEQPADKSRVVIRSSATWDAKLQGSFGLLDIKAGNQYELEYDTDIQDWSIKIISINYLTPNSVGNIIPDNPQRLTYYSMNNCNYVAEVTLPATAEDGAVIIISSTACEESQLSGSNILYGGSKTIKPGEQSVYRYQSINNASGWIIDSVSIEPQDNMGNEIPSSMGYISVTDNSDETSDSTANVSDKDDSNEIPDSQVHISSLDDSSKEEEVVSHEQSQSRKTELIPKTLFMRPDPLDRVVLPSGYNKIVIDFSNDNWANELELPKDPADKSIVAIRYSGRRTFHLRLLSMFLQFQPNNEYFFEYHADIRKWKVSGESVAYLTPSITGSTIPDNPKNLTYFMIDNDNWVYEVTLPAKSVTGAIIIITSTADSDSKISDSNIGYSDIKTIKPGVQYICRYETTCKVSGWWITSIPVEPQDNMGNEIPSSMGYISVTDNSDETSDSTANVSDKDDSNEISDFQVHISSLDDNSKEEEVVSHGQSQSRKTQIIPKTLSTTPIKLGNGVLPSGYDEIVFELSDGNWTKDIILPLQPADKSIVVIKSSATFVADLHLPFTSLKITADSEYTFQYHADLQQWDIEGTGVNILTPNSVGNTLSESTQRITYYLMKNDDWVPEITLPSTGKDGTLIIIRSMAASDSKISAEHLLYDSTTTIKSGDQYVFKYLEKFNRWVLESAPIRQIEAGDIQDEIPYPTSQTTLVTITDNSWRETIKLPEKAADRDKITLKSSTDTVTYINADNVNEPGVMKLQKGEQYDFFYIAENGKWQLVQSPDTLYQAQDITDGKVPELRTPRTFINAANGNYQPELRLPTAQQPGSRVIITSSAEWDISVVADETNEKVFNGETVVFKVDGKGLWFRETVTIDLLLLYSDKAADRLGKEVMEARLTEGLALTNKALENSGANFRYRAVDIRQVAAKAHWRELGHPLNELREDLEVQGWRNTLKADGIYYEGTEDGCGLAWLGPSEKNMVGTGSTNCGTTVMRHELGHNMGIYHGGESESYNQGYGLLSTIMAGNDSHYYSTPNRYRADYGIAIGTAKNNGVRMMNEISAGVAAYR